MGISLCDVTVTLKSQRKIVNIFFLKQDTFFYKKMYVWHFYQKMHTELHSGLHYIDSQHLCPKQNTLQTDRKADWHAYNIRAHSALNTGQGF